MPITTAIFRRTVFLFNLIILILFNYCFSQETMIIDSRHYSNVLGEMRNFRIFLPPDYSTSAVKRYPVIYFLHGWGQRFFGDGSDAYAGFDKGDQNKGDNIAKYVSAHDVIVVKSDGYNRSPDEEYYKRPYNVSPVETFRQFPVYFPELISFIDENYKTIANREHRGISGLSMGGFMTFWIGAKYPQLFTAAGSFCGSPEFEVGPKDFPVEYRHIDMFKNFYGMNVRLHFGDKDFIRGYHEDMNRIWPQIMDNYQWKMYDAEHSTCGLGEMFDSIMNTFKHPPSKPEKWNHIDVYPNFSVWDYNINSDRNTSGFTILENVDKNGFRISVREHVPDGELIQKVNVTITTPPLYVRNQVYTINDIEISKSKTVFVTSDAEGRLKISLNGNLHVIGINKKSDKSNVCLHAITIADMPWATAGKEVKLNIRLLNKGFSAAKNVHAKISATSKNTQIIRSKSIFGDIPVNGTATGKTLLAFKTTDSAEVVKFRLVISDDNNKWTEFFEVPVQYDAPEVKDFEIADGKVFTVVNAGTDLATVALGNGNGDGIANPGESIVILVKDSGKYFRTELLSSDKFINPNGINIRKSDNWTNFDHVGASEKYNEALISSDCPGRSSCPVLHQILDPGLSLSSYYTGNGEYKNQRE